MSIIITRNKQYLNERYRWGIIPHLFPHWQAGDVLDLMQGTKQPATGYAVVKSGVIDLDGLEVVRL